MARRKKRVFEPETVEIRDITQDGRGVAVGQDGKTVFVHGLLPGESASVTRWRTHRSFDEARVNEILVTAEDRVTPGCKAFDVCGGCALQHASTDLQLSLKQNHLLDNLQKLGSVTPKTVLKPLAGDPWRYRRRGRLAVRYVHKKQRVLIGFRERSAHYVADIDECPILAPPLDLLIEPLAVLVEKLSLKERIPQIEVAVGSESVILVFRVLDAPIPEDLALLKEFEQDHSVSVMLQTGGPNTLTWLSDAVPLFYELGDWQLKLAFEPTDFVQVNEAMNASMIRQGLDLLKLESGETVLDLFCGLGNFTLPIAKQDVDTVGVEGDQGLVQRAQQNAEANGLGQVQFFEADLFQDFADLSWANQRYDAVVLDPPRAGAEMAVTRMEQLAPKRILYVSCHPATLARDAGELVHKHGYTLDSAGIVNMFPHTAHVESMALFTR